MKLTISIALLVALSFLGCTNSENSLMPSTTKTTSKNLKQNYIAYDKASEYKIKAFKQEQRRVGMLTKKDTNYKSFASVLTTEEKKIWFNNIMFLLWDRQISKQEYIAKGMSKIPSHKYEFTFIANNF